MSQRTRKRNRNLDESSQSQSGESSQSSRGNNRASLTAPSEDEDHTRSVIATVKFILNHMATKFPIKRADLVKECCDGNGKIFSAILETVTSQLKFVYGIVFHEVAASKSNKQYICYSEYPCLLAKNKKNDFRDQSLLLLILSYIFIKGTAISEGALLNYLQRLDIKLDEEHEHFGDVKKSIETFRKQLYLKRDKKVSETSNEEKILFEWGERAFMEFDQKTMLTEIAKVS
ncbi:Non-structural maintenance of chromosomes element 3 like [Pseudolycoriella hygida]|uniref:Non-structural maintenance of chromosomes element 3 like n=1 Tax=Pseudolycoriella hygida TaxID=35572 RepID=A0A9Q0S0X1_9DIPT|nr:Non-structural maintenance of chromosomes element 3 like [Pseudolycoriella hygida]